MVKFKAIELFCGVGGMSLGFTNAGFDVVGAVEIDPIHAHTHALNFPRGATLVRDVAGMSGNDLRTASGIAPRAELHVLFGGPPCQGFSFGGKMNPRDPRNIGVLEFARLVRELRPLYFVMENVAGLLARQFSETLSLFMGLIAAAGYDFVAPVQTLDAADYGLPQRRRRVFFLGYRKGCIPPRYPQPYKHTVTVTDAIGDLPLLGNISSLYERDTVRVAVTKPSDYAKGLRDAEQLDVDYELTSCLLSHHSEAVTKRFRDTLPGAQEPVSRFFRLEGTGQSRTLRAGTDITRGRFTAPRPIHPTEARCITVREAARLHSFPDSFKLHSTIWHGFRQIGNAVPPRLAEAVAVEIRTALRT